MVGKTILLLVVCSTLILGCVQQNSQVTTKSIKTLDPTKIIGDIPAAIFGQADVYGYWQEENSWGSLKNPIRIISNTACLYHNRNLNGPICYDYSDASGAGILPLARENENSVWWDYYANYSHHLWFNKSSYHLIGKGIDVLSLPDLGIEISKFENISDAEFIYNYEPSKLKQTENQKLNIPEFGNERIGAQGSRLYLIYRRNNVVVRIVGIGAGSATVPELESYAGIIDARLQNLSSG